MQMHRIFKFNHCYSYLKNKSNLFDHYDIEVYISCILSLNYEYISMTKNIIIFVMNNILLDINGNKYMLICCLFVLLVLELWQEKN